MKKAFTMIELIFVIVILGILAAVAIPKLMSTRDDAEIAGTANNISIVASDVASYYLSQGEFADDLHHMTNVALPIKLKNQICAEIISIDKKQIKIKKGVNGLCEQVWKLDSLQNASRTLFSDGIILIEE